MTGGRAVRHAVGLAAFVVAVMWPSLSAAQESVTDVLNFLLTNRSIATSEAERDEQAAAAMRETISSFLQIELATLPTAASSTGFTYRVDSELGGVFVRSSSNFGPFFVERSLTAGALRPAFYLAYDERSFDKIDGRSLDDGTLLALAGRLQGDAEPFDRETLSLKLRTRTVTLSTNVGITDRLELSGSLPFVRLTLEGERVDTLRGVSLVQATGRADASGIGDVSFRAKYNVLRSGGSGIAVGVETRLGTGAADNLLGAGETSVKPRLIASFERDRVAVHGEAGYAFRGASDEFAYGSAVTFAASSRVTLVGEMLGQRLASVGRLTEIVTPHPRLTGVETLRLSGVPEATHRLMAVGGIKWNVASTWLLAVSVIRPMTSAGLTANVIPTAVVEYAFGR